MTTLETKIGLPMDAIYDCLQGFAKHKWIKDDEDFDAIVDALLQREGEDLIKYKMEELIMKAESFVQSTIRRRDNSINKNEFVHLMLARVGYYILKILEENKVLEVEIDKEESKLYRIQIVGDGNWRHESGEYYYITHETEGYRINVRTLIPSNRYKTIIKGATIEGNVLVLRTNSKLRAFEITEKINVNSERNGLDLIAYLIKGEVKHASQSKVNTNIKYYHEFRREVLTSRFTDKGRMCLGDILMDFEILEDVSERYLKVLEKKKGNIKTSVLFNVINSHPLLSPLVKFYLTALEVVPYVNYRIIDPNSKSIQNQPMSKFALKNIQDYVYRHIPNVYDQVSELHLKINQI